MKKYIEVRYERANIDGKLALVNPKETGNTRTLTHQHAKLFNEQLFNSLILLVPEEADVPDTIFAEQELKAEEPIEFVAGASEAAQGFPAPLGNPATGTGPLQAAETGSDPLHTAMVNDQILAGPGNEPPAEAPAAPEVTETAAPEAAVEAPAEAGTESAGTTGAEGGQA